LQDLSGTKLTIEEAVAVILHMVSNAFGANDKAYKGTRGDKNAIALDVWHKELKLIALGVHSQLSPIELEFDLQRRAAPTGGGGGSQVLSTKQGNIDINDSFFDQYDLNHTANTGAAHRASPGLGVKPPPVDEIQRELLINSFKQVNSGTKAQYMGILTPLGQEANPPGGAHLDAALKNRMNKEVIIPIPENLRYVCRVSCVVCCMNRACICMFTCTRMCVP